MSNPIDNGSRVNGGAYSAPRGKAAQAGKSSEQAVASSGSAPAADSRVESERLQQVRERIDAAPEGDLGRVEEIKRALAEGRLPLDPERIADKFAQIEGLLND
jgi:negative regulator of flagellin synthesis FlgM